MPIIFCPHCPTKTTSKGRVFGEELKIVERDYSGHRGIDIACCEMCGKDYIIQYDMSVKTIEEYI